MNVFIEQLRDYPFIALFLSLGLGYLIGKIRIGKFQLGGIAGSLLVAVFLGQIGGITVSNEVKSIFFALFIFMVGYNGGPQFFASFKPSSLTRLLAAFIMTVTGLLTVLAVSVWAGLDKGLAAGLAAGGLTQSAIIGTAGTAIDQLGLSSTVADTLKTNVAVGYSITYIFGSLGPILMMSILPILYKWNIRKEAKDLAENMGGGTKEMNEGEFLPLNRISSRAYIVAEHSGYIGQTLAELEAQFNNDFTVESVIRYTGEQEKEIAVDDYGTITAGDALLLSGLTKAIAKVNNTLGNEIGEFSTTANVIEERRKIVLTNKKLAGKTIQEIHDLVAPEARKGIYLSQVSRMGHDIATLPKTELHIGDELTLVGQNQHLDKAVQKLGYKSPMPSFTDFTVLSLGMVVGFLVGEISFSLNGTHIALGSGLGCLLSGLTVGYLRMRTPCFGNINAGAAQFMQTFGLAVFVAVVGLNAGAPALTAIKEHGLTLLLLGVVVTMVPQFVTFFINYYLLKIKNPVEALAVIAGSRSANPAFSTLLDKTGNSTPVPSFTMTYAVANIFLTLWGPVIITLIAKTQ